MDDLDRKLLQAWQHTRGLLMRSDAGRAEARRRFEVFARSQLAAPLRSWALVLRASDSRISDGAISDVGLRISDWAKEKDRGIEASSHRGMWGDDPSMASQAKPSEIRDPNSEIENWFAAEPYNKVTGQLWLTRGVLERLCRPVSIKPPGVRVDFAAARLGVSRQTIWRWFRKAEEQEGRKVHRTASTRRRGNEHVADAPFWVGRVRTRASNGLVKDLYPNRADRKRDEALYWSASPIDPGGLVAMGDWGALRVRLLDKFKVQSRGVEEAGGVQIVRREWREQAGRHGRWQWVCPNAERSGKRSRDQAIEPSRGHRAARPIASSLDPSVARSLDPFVPARFLDLSESPDRSPRPCLGHCDNLYWPLPVWTIPAMFDEDAAALCNQPLTGGFVCRNCAGLIYESSEAHWGRGETVAERDVHSEAIAWRRFVQRLSAGMVGSLVASP